MASDPLAELRLALMQEVLPVGMAMVERARRGGPAELVSAFTEAADPLAQLRREGDDPARRLRDRLDRLVPGLGNPVVRVQVQDLRSPEAPVVAGGEPAAEEARDPAARDADLRQHLERIAGRLSLLEQRLQAGV